MLLSVIADVSPACAQQYPTKPIRLIVASAAGGGADIIARLLGQKLAEGLGQQVVVDNRPGGGGSIGIELGVKAAPDGYTLTLITPTYAINPSLYPIKFDALNDFTAVSLIAKGPLIAIVHPSVAARSLRELIAMAKTKPGEITFGSSGQGAIIHLATELFLHMAQIKMTHVPYKGGGPALTDLIGGQISLLFATPQVCLPHVSSGRVRALAVTSAERSAALPSVPTIAESGVPGYEVTNWHGIVAPKGLPRPLVERINAEVNRAIKLKDMIERLNGDGVAPAGGSPEQFFEHVRKEIEQWRSVVAQAGVKLN